MDIITHPAVWCATVSLFAGVFTIFRNFKRFLNILAGGASILSAGLLFQFYLGTFSEITTSLLTLAVLTLLGSSLIYIEKEKIKPNEGVKPKVLKKIKDYLKIILVTEILAFILLNAAFILVGLGYVFNLLLPIILTLILLHNLIVNWLQFLSYKVAIAQFIASLIVTFNVLSLLDLGTIEEIILRSILTAVLTFLAHLLVKSVVNEVLKRKQIELVNKNITEANKKLKLIDKAKSEFISIASHQLRTPLTSVKGFTSLILEGSFGKITPKQKKNIEKIFINNEKLILLVEDMLNVSRLEAGRLEYDFAPADIVSLIEKDVVQNMKIQAQNKKIYLRFKKPGVKIPKLKIDERKMIELVGNLVNNAVKFTKKGGVEVSMQKKGESLVIKVKDTGIGLSKEETTSIFNQFKKGTSTKASGTGLGMYISRKFAEAHGGTVIAQSPGKGKGSTFILELPIKK